MKTEKQLTAVEWLEEQINPYGVSVHQSLFEQAKEMEKEQINNAHYEGSENYRRQYYNETFKSE
jgi:hypothetical protein